MKIIEIRNIFTCSLAILYIFGHISWWPPKWPKMTLKYLFPKIPNHIKLSVNVRNDVYNRFKVFLENIYFFVNLNNRFRACLRPLIPFR